MPFQTLKRQLADSLAQTLKDPRFPAEAFLSAFSSPPDAKLGHIALPCFGFAKQLGVQSNELAARFAEALKKQGLECQTAGPYLNVRWNPQTLYQETLSQIFTQKGKFGEDSLGAGKTIVIEYCSPNIAKKLAFHHIRSTLIGAVLANCYRSQGFKTVRMNFVGDWGAQFARLLAAFELWGKKDALASPEIGTAMNHLLEIYVRFHKEIEVNPALEQKAASALARLESQTPAVVEIWNDIRKVSEKAMAQTLKRLHVEFDLQEGESNYLEPIKEQLETFKTLSKAEMSEGAWIVNLDGIKTPALIQKSDGTTLYLTRDIAAALDRFKRFHFDRMLYVVSQQQSLHFQQLFGVLTKMGNGWASKCHHIAFGTVRFGSEKMSTREGKVVLLDDLLNEAHQRALAVCTEKNPTLANKEEVAEQVGVGAVIFGELSAHRMRDIDFDWEQILALDGETGPYVQYSLVRCHSLLKKAAEKNYPINESHTPTETLGPEEEALVLCLAKFRSVLQQVLAENEPYYLTRYLIDIAKFFNRFYYQVPVLQSSDPAVRTQRLNLVSATKQVMENGFALLGMQCPEEM